MFSHLFLSRACSIFSGQRPQYINENTTQVFEKIGKTVTTGNASRLNPCTPKTTTKTTLAIPAITSTAAPTAASCSHTTAEVDTKMKSLSIDNFLNPNFKLGPKTTEEQECAFQAYSRTSTGAQDCDTWCGTIYGSKCLAAYKLEYSGSETCTSQDYGCGHSGVAKCCKCVLPFKEPATAATIASTPGQTQTTAVYCQIANAQFLLCKKSCDEQKKASPLSNLPACMLTCSNNRAQTELITKCTTTAPSKTTTPKPATTTPAKKNTRTLATTTPFPVDGCTVLPNTGQSAHSGQILATLSNALAPGSRESPKCESVTENGPEYKQTDCQKPHIKENCPVMCGQPVPAEQAWAWNECALECAIRSECVYWLIRDRSGCVLKKSKGDVMITKSIVAQGDKDCACKVGPRYASAECTVAATTTAAAATSATAAAAERTVVTMVVQTTMVQTTEAATEAGTLPSLTPIKGNATTIAPTALNTATAATLTPSAQDGLTTRVNISGQGAKHSPTKRPEEEESSAVIALVIPIVIVALLLCVLVTVIVVRKAQHTDQIATEDVEIKVLNSSSFGAIRDSPQQPPRRRPGANRPASYLQPDSDQPGVYASALNPGNEPLPVYSAIDNIYSDDINDTLKRGAPKLQHDGRLASQSGAPTQAVYAEPDPNQPQVYAQTGGKHVHEGLAQAPQPLYAEAENLGKDTRQAAPITSRQALVLVHEYDSAHGGHTFNNTMHGGGGGVGSRPVSYLAPDPNQPGVYAVAQDLEPDHFSHQHQQQQQAVYAEPSTEQPHVYDAQKVEQMPQYAFIDNNTYDQGVRPGSQHMGTQDDALYAEPDEKPATQPHYASPGQSKGRGKVKYLDHAYTNPPISSRGEGAGNEAQSHAAFSDTCV